MRRRNPVVVILLLIFVLIWLRIEEMTAAMTNILAAIADLLAVVPDIFWILLAVACLLGTIIVAGAFLIRAIRRDPPVPR